MKRWFLPAAARARGQSNDLNGEVLASNLFNCCKEVINAPPVPSISRCIHIVYRHKNVSEYQWSNFIYNCMSTFLHYVHCKDALLHCSAPGGERCESLTRVDEIECTLKSLQHWMTNGSYIFSPSFINPESDSIPMAPKIWAPYWPFTCWYLLSRIKPYFSFQFFSTYFHFLNTEMMQVVNTLRPRQNRRHFADHIFKCIFVNENVWI